MVINAYTMIRFVPAVFKTSSTVDVAPGIPFSSVKSGLAALDTIPAAGTLQLIAFIGILEAGFAIRKEEIEAAQIKASGWCALSSYSIGD